MPWQRFRFGRVSDGQIAKLIEDVMARWPTNDPIIAVGGFSRSYVDEGWDQKLRDKTTFGISSASITEKGGAFTIHYRRSLSPSMPDEIRIYTNDGMLPNLPDPAPALNELVEQLALPAPAQE